jgi:serine-type D-Ala-D-Ala carboxypeptidase/endopeptidase (penicillin-binding protein 4)
LHWINSKLISWFVIVIIFFATAFCNQAAADNNIGFILADEHGTMLLSKNESNPFVPASILKIVTSLAAISCLGENYQYQTLFYYNKSSSNLHIKGFGDPLFISEEINKACRLLSLELKKNQITTINNIILDNSFFENKIDIPGKSDTLNPYDAFQGALCANFNTIFFKTDSVNNKFISAEEQTPLLPIFNNKIRATGLKQGRITLSEKESLFYPGFLMQYFLKENKIEVSGKILPGEFPEGTATEQNFLFRYTSDIFLTEIIQNLLEYSNNFMANQVLLTLGGEVKGAPSNLEKSTSVVNSFLEETFQTDLKNLKIKYVEGSGISRSNSVSCEAMIKILIKFMPYHHLMRQNDNGFYKTGTLSGIRTIAGYIIGRNESLYPYVIMINKKNTGYENILKNMEQKIKDL